MRKSYYNGALAGTLIVLILFILFDFYESNKKLKVWDKVDKSINKIDLDDKLNRNIQPRNIDKYKLLFITEFSENIKDLNYLLKLNRNEISKDTLYKYFLYDDWYDSGANLIEEFIEQDYTNLELDSLLSKIAELERKLIRSMYNLK